MAYFTGAPLYTLLPDAPWTDGPATDADAELTLRPAPPEDVCERDRAFAPPTLTEELALLHLWANETAPAAPCTCATAPVAPCLRCRVAALIESR